MPAERRRKIVARLVGEGSPPLDARRLCQVCAEVTGMTGAGIMLMSGDEAQGSICTSDETSFLIEELQYELGEGPCLDAYHQDRPVFEPDLAAPETRRWLAFSIPAIEAGVGALFAFPVKAGAIRLGALSLYRSTAGALSNDQRADGLAMATVAARAVLSMQAQAEPGELAAELEAGGDFRAVVHQATGMIAVQLGLGIDEALMRLRAHAFASDRTLEDVAADVVGRRERFTDGDRFDTET